MARSRQLSTFAGILLLIWSNISTTDNYKSAAPVIPKTWDEEALSSFELPMPEAEFSPRYISAEYYYKMPVRPVYKTYPIYHPGRDRKAT